MIQAELEKELTVICAKALAEGMYIGDIYSALNKITHVNEIMFTRNINMSIAQAEVKQSTPIVPET